MKPLVRFLIYTGLMALAFLGGYRGMDLYFRAKLIPYPFELFGIAAGLGLACWTLAFIQFVRWVASRRRKKSDHFKEVVAAESREPQVINTGG